MEERGSYNEKVKIGERKKERERERKKERKKDRERHVTLKKKSFPISSMIKNNQFGICNLQSRETESTVLLSITKVKQRLPWSVLRWMTTLEQ